MPPSPTVRRLASPLRLEHVGAAEAVLALLVVAVVALMIVPLPTWLLDTLLATNLSLSVAVLLVVLYVPDALQIATFPTLLLLTTLLRLALNVSSTRLILLQADAGSVIRSFGQFVVRGNYVVGAVVFLILTIIQFVVIAKGGERVAEVGARFVLDAMPGKQMAIDAELRSGSIDGAEARRRRRQLARESQFYGAMDGAMKFVKGDVVASLLITCINLLGGLAIGVGQRGLGVEAALHRYGLLTIGDGLVTQIPALVLATAAGILVTRVASEEPDTPLGRELASQLLGAPRALQVAGLMVLALGAVPGLPLAPFVAIGAALLFASRARARHLRSAEAEPLPATPSPRRGLVFVPAVVPWSLDVAADLADLVDDDVRGDTVVREGLARATTRVRERVFASLGVPLPPARVRVAADLPPRHVVLSLFEVPARVAALDASVSDADVAAHVVGLAEPIVAARAADYLGITETQTLLDQLESIAPAIVRQVVPKPVPVPVLADVLRRLVEERVSVRDLRAILEALSQLAAVEKDPLQLAELLRGHLRRATTWRLTRGEGELGVYLLDPAIEDEVRRAITRTTAGSFLTLAPAAARDIVRAVRRALTEAPPPDAGIVVLTQPDVRRFVRKLLETDLPEATVVSFAELLPEIALRPLSRATLAGLGA